MQSGEEEKKTAPTGFSFERMEGLTQQLESSLPVGPYVLLLEELLKMFKAMGKTMSLAFSGRQPYPHFLLQSLFRRIGKGQNYREKPR